MNNFIYIIILIEIIFGIFTAYIAEQKNYSGIAWLILGCLFGPIAFLTSIGLPEKKFHSQF